MCKYVIKKLNFGDKYRPNCLRHIVCPPCMLENGSINHASICPSNIIAHRIDYGFIALRKNFNRLFYGRGTKVMSYPRWGDLEKKHSVLVDLNPDPINYLYSLHIFSGAKLFVGKMTCFNNITAFMSRLVSREYSAIDDLFISRFVRISVFFVQHRRYYRCATIIYVLSLHANNVRVREKKNDFSQKCTLVTVRVKFNLFTTTNNSTRVPVTIRHAFYLQPTS